MLLLSVELLGLICSQHVVKPSFRGVKPCNLALYRKIHPSVNLYFLGFPVYVFLSVPESRQTAQKLVVMGSYYHKIPEILRKFSPKKLCIFFYIFSLSRHDIFACIFIELSVIFPAFKPWKKQKFFFLFPRITIYCFLHISFPLYVRCFPPTRQKAEISWFFIVENI